MRIKLLHDEAEEEERSIFEENAFCIKRAVIECLKSQEAASHDNSLNFDTLKKMLLARYSEHFASDVADGGDKLYSRLSKLLNRNSHFFVKCAKTYSLKKIPTRTQ